MTFQMKNFNEPSISTFQPKKPLYYGLLGLLLISVSMTSHGMGASEATLAPPIDTAAQDKAGVDLLSGLPIFSQTDLTIGNGDLSLTHTLGSSAGYFNGFYDQRYGYSIDRDLQKNLTIVKLGGQVEYFTGLTAPFRPYRANGGTLVGVWNQGFKYTNRDGVQLLTGTYGNSIGGNQIIYPNGFTIYSKAYGLETNTGLKFLYLYDNPKHSRVSGIRAINSAFEACSLTMENAGNCSNQNNWPQTAYTWPSDADWSAQDERHISFKVKDAQGQTTEYIQKRFISNANNAIHTMPYEMRVIEVKDSDSLQVSRQFDYFESYECFLNGLWTCSVPRWLVKSADIKGVSYQYDFVFTSYNIGYSGNILLLDGHVDAPSGRSSMQASNHDSIVGPIRKQSSWPSGSAYYDNNASNRLLSLTEKGIRYAFSYDGRGNITLRKQQPAVTSAPSLPDITESAVYPAGCSNLKTCNKPTAVTDANGNTTYYEYHAESGYISKVTRPADNNGVHPVTFYKYTPLYANYYRDNDTSLTRASTPVWRLTQEISCMSKASTGTGCQAGDEMTIDYEYGSGNGPNNLWLTGKVVRADNQSRRTCYEYDIYGHQIGETQPNGTGTTCP